MEDYEIENVHENIINDMGDTMDSIYNVMHTTILIVVFGMLVLIILKVAMDKLRNTKAEVVMVRARVTSKRSNEGYLEELQLVQMTHSDSSVYYVTFLMKEGGRKEFKVSGEAYGMLVEDDIGMLCFRGDEYLGFQREIE